MAATMRRPEAFSFLFLLLLSLFFTFTSPAASLCVPRNSSSHSATPPSDHPPPAPTPASAVGHKASPPPTYSSPSPKRTSNPPLAAPPSIADIVDALCSHTDYKDLCISSTQSLLPATGAVTAESLLRLEMKAVRTGAGLAKSKVTEQAAAPGADPTAAAYLRDCADQYDDACSTLDEVETNLAARDKGAVGVKLSAVLDSFATCEDGFAEAALESPVAAADLELQHLASNCLALAELVL